jgi:hypothetical protein
MAGNSGLEHACDSIPPISTCEDHDVREIALSNMLGRWGIILSRWSKSSLKLSLCPNKNKDRSKKVSFRGVGGGYYGRGGWGA